MAALGWRFLLSFHALRLSRRVATRKSSPWLRVVDSMVCLRSSSCYRSFMTITGIRLERKRNWGRKGRKDMCAITSFIDKPHGRSFTKWDCIRLGRDIQAFGVAESCRFS